MIGKKNIVFGLVLLVFTAGLGPLMVLKYVPDQANTLQEKQQTLGRLQTLKSNEFEEELEPLSAEAIAKANTDGILILNKVYNVDAPIRMIKGGPHAHGNLEALLNIVTGILLCFLVIPSLFKQIISWAFIIGSLGHAGLLYMIAIFEQSWAMTLLNTGIGPFTLLGGIILLGIASVIGFKGEPVRDIPH